VVPGKRKIIAAKECRKADLPAFVLIASFTGQAKGAEKLSADLSASGGLVRLWRTCPPLEDLSALLRRVNLPYVYVGDALKLLSFFRSAVVPGERKLITGAGTARGG